MLKVTVIRSKWDRGRGAEVAESDGATKVHLVGPNGNCCLGFACLTAGVAEQELRGKESPIELTVDGLKVPESLWKLFDSSGLPPDTSSYPSRACRDLMAINDDSSKDDAYREERITKRGREAGIEFTFVD